MSNNLITFTIIGHVLAAYYRLRTIHTTFLLFMINQNWLLAPCTSFPHTQTLLLFLPLARLSAPSLPSTRPPSRRPAPPSSSSILAHTRLYALKMALVVPVTVTTRSGQEPSLMWILAPDSSRMLWMISPPFPMIGPTSYRLVRYRQFLIG